MSFSQGSVILQQKRSAGSPVTAGARNGTSIVSGYVELGGGTSYPFLHNTDVDTNIYRFRLGDLDFVQNGSLFTMDDANKQISFNLSSGTRFLIDTSANVYKIGDITGTLNSSKIVIDDSNAAKSITYTAPTNHIWQVGAAGATEAMRINSAGEVLIGSPSDSGSYKLQVTGDTLLSGQNFLANTITDYIYSSSLSTYIRATYDIYLISNAAYKIACTGHGVYIGGGGPATAILHIAPGSSSANNSILKFTTGSLLSTAEAGAFEYVTPTLSFTNGGAQRQEIPLIQQSRVSSQFDKTSNTTLGDITGLTATVVAGKFYRFIAKLFTTSNVAGGVKVAIAGTCTATLIRYEGLTINAGTVTQSRSAALGTAVGAITAVTAAYILIEGFINVNAAGTLTVQFAQNASNGTASSVLTGSHFEITEMA